MLEREPVVCGCPGCELGLGAFTVGHFVAWAADLELDTGGRWIVEPFQAAFVGDLFEFTRAGVPAECWLVVPEGNAKTTLVSGLGLYYLEHFPLAAIPVAASAKEQADTLYLQAEGFVMRSPRLVESQPDLQLKAKGLEQLSPGRRKDVPRFQCQEGFRRIKFFRGGRIQIRAADDRTGDGIIPAGIMIIDELHRHRDLKLYRTWSGKGEKRNAPLVVISTAGEPGGEFEETRERLRQGDEVTRDGCFVRARSETSLLHEYAVPEGGDVEDLELVAAANPLSTVTVETLRRKRTKKSWDLAHWRRLTCNLPTRSGMAAIEEAEWYGAATKDRIPVGVPVWLGLDLAWKWDTTAAVPLWWRDETYRLLGPAAVLVPPRDGSSLDPNLVERALLEIHARNPVHTVVMDMSQGEQLAAWIERELGAIVVERSQSNKAASENYSRFMEALREGWLRHQADDRELTRHALNAVARILPHGDATFERPSQTRQGGDQERRVIDALTAASMVHAVAVELSKPQKPTLVASW
ncbi:MAG TPA: hypothetical protein VNI55_02265 [Gaiellaceae bacterium]|nr:hypothetical protein [Gaiellaceae bacterium]